MNSNEAINLSFSSPFLLNSGDVYKKWRDKKLDQYPESLAELLVEINDPRTLTESEYQAILEGCQKANMAIYAGKTGTDPDPEIPLSLGRRFGLIGLNNNWLADEETGLTSLTVRENGVRKDYIPYTNKAINWHTDGYYNPIHKQIHALNLHVVQKAAAGGENALMDHEIAYILLREKNPAYIEALMQQDVLTIPARTSEGIIERDEETGPVFSVTPSGNLHMRYTIRVSNVIWKKDPLLQEALDFLKSILQENGKYIYEGLLEPGMGLISNNILHNRAAFTDDATHKRHYYRARYFDRLADTDVSL
ncbi:MAG: TauD/TfdA family dioxygenase [Spirochaetia bacterium]|nr:TauD/TfdA family dioxygenase [Spirochaetia bacterium]